ncbi:aminotransferase class IV-domain-containing protein [Aspergillus caelatus]|uniref:Aminotransferase class IV-domain-containing protein n=1 Tax=Aspergillus caelatus TaxID=61420 RepID=A0A5N7AD46_9EURO|nr:aminotransferase class IV-domain-containing protein [Aspergillus caelatus]KAE8367787.1 aminotransferase class IV-domain-containing protein [Aspergillus caelatus]
MQRKPITPTTKGCSVPCFLHNISVEGEYQEPDCDARYRMKFYHVHLYPVLSSLLLYDRSSSSDSFQIISSLRYDPAIPRAIGERTAEPRLLATPYYLLPYHRDRLLNAAICFNWAKAIEFLRQDLDQFTRILETFVPNKSQPWRLRVVIDSSGACKVEANPTASMDPLYLLCPSRDVPQPNTWRVYVDSEYTAPSDFTTHKTTARGDYTAARYRSGILSPQEQAEVLVVNPKGEIMEGSITTPYFRRRKPGSEKDIASKDSGPKWATPSLLSGGNAGTTRRYALAEGFCTEEVITVADLVDGEECWLSNGVRGFIPGRIVLMDPKGSERVPLPR